MARALKILKFFYQLGLICLLILVGYILWLDFRVTAEFSGRKWDLPSHIYARPLELFTGASVSQSEMIWELEQLGYRRVGSAQSKGQFSVANNRVQLFARGFEFWDEVEESKLLMVEFSREQIIALSDADFAPLAIVRLEPLRIGGVFPDTIEDRLPVALEDIPPLLVETLLEVEDSAFYEHYGFSIRGIARAALGNLFAGKIVGGGSTITQQLVKNFYVGNEQTISRKVKEVLMSVLLEFHYSKSEILETYINEVFLGQSGDRAIHGFGMASWHYFRQPLEELEAEQVAFLVGILKGFYDPWSGTDRATARRNVVLQLMANAEIVDSADLIVLQGSSLNTVDRPLRSLNPFPGYMRLVLDELDEQYGRLDTQNEGYDIVTSLDPWLQNQLESSISRGVQSLESGYRIEEGKLQAAGVLTRIGSGQITALVGGRDPKFNGFNRALFADRAIGSLIKPVVYLTALQSSHEYTLSTMIEDAPFILEEPNGENWLPKNYDGLARGPVAIYSAMANSLNLATARLGLKLGVQTVIDTLAVLGVETGWPDFPAYLLGAGGLTPLEVSTLYHSIAADGFYSPLTTIQGIYDSSGEQADIPVREIEQRVDPAYVHLIQYAMQVVMLEGTGKSLINRFPNTALAGKTGTTNDSRDSWFAGYDGRYLGVFWVGRDDNKAMPLTGATGALELWSSTFRAIGAESINYVRPPDVEYFWIDPESNARTDNNCFHAVYLPYAYGSEPDQRMSCDGTEVTEN
jgi:penicillin-binding protein 1B